MSQYGLTGFFTDTAAVPFGRSLRDQAGASFRSAAAVRSLGAGVSGRSSGIASALQSCRRAGAFRRVPAPEPRLPARPRAPPRWRGRAIRQMAIAQRCCAEAWHDTANVNRPGSHVMRHAMDVAIQTRNALRNLNGGNVPEADDDFLLQLWRLVNRTGERRAMSGIGQPIDQHPRRIS